MVQSAKAETNKFVGGLITDASPLTFPDNTSLVDVNMQLNADGSRQRALGIDYEDDHHIITTNVTHSSKDIAFNRYKWENAGGVADNVIICIQIGNEVRFFDGNKIPLSRSQVGIKTFTTSSKWQKFSFASVDGVLVIATGINLVTTAKYENNTLSFTASTIKVRDFFGCQDIIDGRDLTVGNGLTIRPKSLPSRHIYNLRNQGFGIPRMVNDADELEDPIKGFANEHKEIKGSVKYPSNSDTVIGYLYANANDGDDRLTSRYFSTDSIKNPLGTTSASKGFFIIDLLNRGTSRMDALGDLDNEYPELDYPVTALPTDKTPGGATVVGEFAGRVWYGGFNGDVEGGDAKSPNLSSYIAFSRLVVDPSMITQCYQEGDPTGEDTPDIIDTDGGYIRLSNAYGICSFTNLGKDFMVGTKAGFYRIYGGNDSGFSATNYVVAKITDKGVSNANSVVQVENTLIYWSDDGIYWLKPNQFGDWESTNITQQRIQNLFNNLESSSKESAVGVYDGYQRKVRWTYNNSLFHIDPQKELILDINLNAFYERHIGQVINFPILMGGFNTTPYQITEVIDTVQASANGILVGSDEVVVSELLKSNRNDLYEVGYVVVTSTTGTVKYTFASYSNEEFIDWKSYDGTGVDASAILVTGTTSMGDSMRFKQVPYVYVHLKRTEDGFVDDGDDFTPTHQSSCNLQSMWDWANSANSNKWGSPFEAYRYKRHYFASSEGNPFDIGYDVITTKNKLRGRGRSLSLKFTSSPKKEMHLLGWSMMVDSNDTV